MAFIRYNPNPTGRNVGDCAVRAITKALDISWEEAYIKLTMNGLLLGDMPSSDSVWGSLLQQNNFKKCVLPSYCPDCYTVSEFCVEHPEGVYVLALGGHVVTIVDGDIFDSWDSSCEIPLYCWFK